MQRRTFYTPRALSKQSSRAPKESPNPFFGRKQRPSRFPSRKLGRPNFPDSLLSRDEVIFCGRRYTLAHFAVSYLLFNGKGNEDWRRQSKDSNQKEKSALRRTMNSVQILTTPTADTPGTNLLVHHENRRYMFGHTAEGTLRTFVQAKLSALRIEHIFLSGPVGRNTTGGLLGTILTVADAVSSARQQEMETKKKKKIKPSGHMAKTSFLDRTLGIHGGENLTYMLATARRFVFRKGLPIIAHEVWREPAAAAVAKTTAETMRDPDWADENIKVWYVPVYADGEIGKNGAGGSTSSSHGQPASPRKRSHEVMENGGEERTEAAEAAGAGTNYTGASTAADQAKADRALLANIVKQMFDSTWSLDALVETTLHKAKLPAKIFVRDSNGHIKPYDGPLPGEHEGLDVPDIPVLLRRPWPASLVTELPRTASVRQTMCYIVRNYPRRGKVNAEEVKRLGVPKHEIKKLVAGQSVTTVGGTTVTPEMVIGATVEGTGFAVVDLPDRAYIDGFLARPEWTSPGVLGGINTMFWILGRGMADDHRLQAFMRTYSGLRHVVSSPDMCANRLALSSAATLQAKHNRVDPDRFPLLQYNNVPERTPTSFAAAEPALFQTARPGWSVRLAPQVIEQDQDVQGFVDFGAAVDEMDPAVLEMADSIRETVATPAFEEAVAASNRGLSALAAATEVIPLGTGSASPSKYRNVSATLVRVPGVGSYLFDCGENTLGSMERLFGPEKLVEVLRDLRAIWISHLHADHHLGTVGVISAWRDATAQAPVGANGTLPRLMVASHIDMLRFLQDYANLEDFGLGRVRQVSLKCSRNSYHCNPAIFTPAEQAEFGVYQISAVRVDHCYGAMAVSFDFANRNKNSGEETPPLKISYSGDCRPSDEFAQIGRGSALLIHESTFDDELSGDALAKKHCTMSEALSVAQKMGARRVMLTHFSQRYPKIPIFGNGGDASEDGGENDGGVGNNNSSSSSRSIRSRDMEVLVAFDMMRVKLGDFHTAAAYLPALQKLYEEEE